MARNRKRQANGTAWWRKFDSGWYATIDGKRTHLRDENGTTIKGKDRQPEADLAVARLKLAIPQKTSDDTVLVATVADAYLQHLKTTASAQHIDNATRTMNDFCSYCGALPAKDLKKKHVRDWVDQHSSWKSDNTKRGNVIYVSAAFNHAVKEEEILEANPIANFKKPAAFPRITFFKQEEIDEVLEYFNRPAKWRTPSRHRVGEFFRMLLLTGARPFSELAQVTAENIQETDKGMIIRIKAGTDEEGCYRHKSARKTGRDRVLYLFPEAEELLKPLIKKYPKGSGQALFRTPQGAAWTRFNGVRSMCAMKRALKWDEDPEKAGLSLYTCRHTFAKRVLSGFWTNQPATIETVAGLLGNTPGVCFRHYASWCDEYSEPLWAAVGRGRNQG